MTPNEFLTHVIVYGLPWFCLAAIGFIMWIVFVYDRGRK